MDLVYKKPFEELEVTWKDLYLSFNITGLISAKDGEEQRSNKTGLYTLASKSLIYRLKKSLFTIRRDVYYLSYYFFRNYNQDMRCYGVRALVFLGYVIFSGTLFQRLHRDVDEIRKLAAAIIVVIQVSIVSNIFSTNAVVGERKFAYELAKNKIISPLSYCITQFLVSSPYNFILAVLSQLVFHCLLYFSADPSVFIYCTLTLFLEFMFMEALLLLIVEVLRDALLCLVMIVIALAPLLYFTGYFVAVHDMPVWVSWLCYLTPIKVRKRSVNASTLICSNDSYLQKKEGWLLLLYCMLRRTPEINTVVHAHFRLI